MPLPSLRQLKRVAPGVAIAAAAAVMSIDVVAGAAPAEAEAKEGVPTKTCCCCWSRLKVRRLPRLRWVARAGVRARKSPPPLATAAAKAASA